MAPIPVPFVGGSYPLDRKKSDVQRSVNLVPTYVESGYGKSAMFLEPVPGLLRFSQDLYFTSLLYPILVEDSLSVSVPTVRGWLFPFADNVSLGVPSIVGGTLLSTLVLLSYTNERDVNPDQLSLSVPSISGGALTVTINYLSYTNERDVSPDQLSLVVPAIQSGSLTVTIAYINYTNERDVAPDTLSLGVPAITAGSLA